MAAGKLLSRALSFLSPQSSPLPHLRRLSTAVSGDLKPSPENSVSVLHFLRGHGLGDDALAGFDPRLLDSNVDKDLPAKFDLLLARGFSVPEVAKVLRYNYLLHTVSLVSLRERLDALGAIVSDDAQLRRIINRAVRTVSSSQNIQRMVDNVCKLRGWGISEGKIRSFMLSNPRFFQLKPQSVDHAADRTEAFGVSRDSKAFVYAVRILYSMSESTRQSKFRVFESFGWERSAVIALFKTLPYCMTPSEATLVKKLDFLMKEAGFNPSYIAKRPAMLSYSLEKRVRPRFELVNALKSKNLLTKEPCFYKTWCISETKFREKYVIKFMKEEPGICSAYINSVASPKQKASG